MQHVGEPFPMNWATTAGGVFVAPTTVTLTVTTPSGVDVDVSVSSTSVGRHEANWTPAEPGRHTYRWAATGPGAGVEQDVVNVADPRPLALCSLDDFKRHLNMTPGPGPDDEELRVHLTAATLAVERHRNEIVAARPFVDRVDGSHRQRLLLSRYPVISLTSIVGVDTTAYPVEVWELNGATGLITGPSSATLRGSVDVAYYAGYRVVPETFVLAAQIIAAHLWETQRTSPTPAPTFGGGEAEFLTPSGLGFAIPHRAVELLGGRPPVIA